MPPGCAPGVSFTADYRRRPEYATMLSVPAMLRCSFVSPRRGSRAVITAALFAGSTTLGFSSAAQAAEHRVLIVGDSITQGTAGDITWRFQLWRSLQHSSAAGTVDFVGSRSALFNVATNRQDGNHAYADAAFDQDHEATWGTTLGAVVPAAPTMLANLAQPPTVLVVGLGTNDAPGGAPKALALLRRLVASARTAAPGVDVVLQTPFVPVTPRTGAPVNAPYTQAFNAGASSLAAELDTASERVVVASTDALVARTQTWDGHHPTPDGELVIARSTAEALARVGVGDGPHLPSAATWPAVGPTPAVQLSGARATITWADATAGALAYAVEQRRTTAAGQSGPWVLVTQPARTVTTWASQPLTGGVTYSWRLTPVRGLMRGVAGTATDAIVPVATATPNPTTTPTASATPTATPAPVRRRTWWQWW